jgi:putative peptidoglycan lipid II flippase
MSAPSATRQVARAAGAVMAAFVVSKLVSLASQVLITWAFGTSGALDAFYAANRIPDTLFNLIAGGALGSAFIPTFTGLLTKDQPAAAWKLASAVANLVLLVLSAASLLAALFARPIVVYLLASGFADDPAQLELTVQLARIMLPSAAIFGLSGLVMGILNSRQVFLIPALTPAMYPLGLSLGAVAALLVPGLGIQVLAWGVLLGALLHLGLQLPVLLRQGGQYSLTLGLHLPAVREVLRLMGPRLLGVAVVYLNFWVNTRLASAQPVGSVVGITLAFALMMMPQAAIAQSVAIAAMPTFSAQFARGQLAELRQTLAGSLRGVLLLAIPASLGLMVLRTPVTALLYQRGVFTAHSTDLVAWALLWYAAGLVGHCLLEVLVRAFYAQHDTKTPVLVGALAMSLNVALSFAFAAWFTRLGWAPHGGLALANSLATALETTALLVLLRRRLGGLGGRGVWVAAGQAALAAALMSAALWSWLAWSAGRPDWLVALGGLALGGGLYGLILYILRVPELHTLLNVLAQRLR